MDRQAPDDDDPWAAVDRLAARLRQELERLDPTDTAEVECEGLHDQDRGL